MFVQGSIGSVPQNLLLLFLLFLLFEGEHFKCNPCPNLALPLFRSCRNLEPFMRAEMALKVKPYIEERAKERSRANLKQNAGSTEVQNSAPREKEGKTVEKLAEKANVSRNTIQRVEKILEKAEPEVIEKARSGEISINQAYQTVKPAKNRTAQS